MLYMKDNRLTDYKIKPIGMITLGGIKIFLYQNLPNKFQRFMIKKILGIQIDDLREGDKKCLKMNF